MGSQITTGTSVAGHTWNLWKGPNANWEVLSFVSAEGDITDFNVDLNDFFSKYLFAEIMSSLIFVVTLKEYLVAEQGVADTQVLCSFKCGVFIDAKFTTS